MKSFNLTRIATSLLPTALRTPVVAAILRSALSTLQSCHDSIYDNHHGTPYGTYYRLAHTGQRLVLQSLLNDRFDPSARRFVVGDVETKERPFLYFETEIALQPYLRTWLTTEQEDTEDNPILFAETDYTSSSDTTDFIVSIPTALASNLAQIRNSVDDMKVAGVTYAIQYI